MRLTAVFERIEANVEDYSGRALTASDAGGAKARAQASADFDAAYSWLREKSEKCYSGDILDAWGRAWEANEISMLQATEGDEVGAALTKYNAAFGILGLWMQLQSQAVDNLPESLLASVSGKRVGVGIGLAGFRWQYTRECILDMIIEFSGYSRAPVKDGFGTLFQRQEEGTVVQGTVRCAGKSLPVWEVYEDFESCNAGAFFDVLRDRGAAEIVVLCGVDRHYCELMSNLAALEHVRLVYMHGTALSNVHEELPYRDRTTRSQ